MHFRKDGCRLEHSVRAYLDRMPMDKLLFLVNHYSSQGESPITDDLLQNILEVLIARNTTEGERLSPYINMIMELKTMHKKDADLEFKDHSST